jgi:hypothetical protein
MIPHHAKRPTRIFRRLVLGVSLVTLLGSLAGCNSTPDAKPVRPASLRGPRNAQAEYNQLVRLALEHWNVSSKASQFSYVLDPDNRRLSPRLRASVAALFPAAPEVEPENTYVLYIDRVAVPDENFAYVTIRTTNRYDAVEITIVCQKIDQKWTFWETIFISEGLMETSLLNFNWETYRARLVSNGELE